MAAGWRGLGLALVLATTLPLYTLEEGRPVEQPVRWAEDVPDALFSLLLGLVDADAFGGLDRPALEALVAERGTTRLPLDDVRWIQRSPVGPDEAVVRVQFVRPVDLDLPYSLLGYHPGALKASAELRLREWTLGPTPMWLPGDDGGEHVVLQDVHLWMIERGRLELDVDAWLDRLFGSKLDDVAVTGVATFVHEGRRLGLGFGYNRGGKGRSGAFDFGEDEMIFPAPKPLLHVGKTLRARGERRLAAALNPGSEAGSADPPATVRER